MCPSLANNVDRVTILEYHEDTLQTVCDMWPVLKPFAVVLYAYGASDLWLDNTAEAIEAKYPEIAVLWNHPNTPRYIKKHKMPSPGIPILILQSKQALMQEKARLRELGYYKYWR